MYVWFSARLRHISQQTDVLKDVIPFICHCFRETVVSIWTHGWYWVGRLFLLWTVCTAEENIVAVSNVQWFRLLISYTFNFYDNLMKIAQEIRNGFNVVVFKMHFRHAGNWAKNLLQIQIFSPFLTTHHFCGDNVTNTLCVWVMSWLLYCVNIDSYWLNHAYWLMTFFCQVIFKTVNTGKKKAFLLKNLKWVWTDRPKLHVGIHI